MNGHLEGTFLCPDLDNGAKLGSRAPQLLLLAVREGLEGGVSRDEGVVVATGQLHSLAHLERLVGCHGQEFGILSNCPCLNVNPRICKCS